MKASPSLKIENELMKLLVEQGSPFLRGKKARRPNGRCISEKDAYTAALDAYKQGGAKEAIAPMKSFITKFPNSAYIGNAHFWLAEFYLAITPAQYENAKNNYEAVAKRYPNSAKAPHALYQLYSIAKDVDKNPTAANLYKQKILTTYPKSQESSYFR